MKLELRTCKVCHRQFLGGKKYLEEICIDCSNNCLKRGDLNEEKLVEE